MYAGVQRKMANLVPNCSPRINKIPKKKLKKTPTSTFSMGVQKVSNPLHGGHANVTVSAGAAQIVSDLQFPPVP